MSKQLHVSGQLVAGSITGITIWKETIPEGQTRVYKAHIICRTAAGEYFQAWKQFTMFNIGAGAQIMDNAFVDIIPTYTNPTLVGIGHSLSTTLDEVVIILGEPTTPVDLSCDVFLTWDEC